MDSGKYFQELDPKYLLSQLNTARREINNLRQQIKSLKYIFDKDVNGIKRLINLHTDGIKPGYNPAGNGQAESTSSTQPNTSLTLEPIGVINTGFPNKRGVPRQPGICKEARGKITLFNSVFTNPEHSLNGLQDFSHMWILFHFHRNESTHVRAKVAPPRLNGARTGVFSTRSPHRPCPIGLSLVKIIKIEGDTILFEGVDTVDGTPVLDIKPYIPQYDNPLHVEKHIRRENSSNINPLERVDWLDTMQENLGIESQDLNSMYDELDSNRDLEDFLLPLTDANQIFDVSRDEEIALRLQTEEFQQLETENLDDNNFETDSRDNPGPSSQGIAVEQENPSVSDASINNLIDNLNLEMQDPRHSRLLDGADGSSTICGTDMDLINRRALNSRLDNSPVRMGVREAPDGEEGLESQSLRPSATIGNIQSIPANPSNNFSSFSTSELSVEMAESNQFQVRVPDWISQPRTRSLSVLFNDRALRQLNEIVNDKAEEQKRAIINVLQEDPRSVYLRQRWANQFYTFLIHDLHISCRFDDARGIVTVFQIRHAGRTCECGEPEWQCLGHSPIS